MGRTMADSDGRRHLQNSEKQGMADMGGLWRTVRMEFLTRGSRVRIAPGGLFLRASAALIARSLGTIPFPNLSGPPRNGSLIRRRTTRPGQFGWRSARPVPVYQWTRALGHTDGSHRPLVTLSISFSD